MVNYTSGAIPESVIGLGLKSATLMDYAIARSDFALASGLFIACLAPFSAGQQVTGVGAVLSRAGATTAGVNAMGLYTPAGVKIDTTGDMTATFSGTLGEIKGALSAGVYTVPTTDQYYIVGLTHFSLTTPQILGCTAAVSAQAFAPIESHYDSVFLSAQAALPASFTPSAATINSAKYYLFAY